MSEAYRENKTSELRRVLDEKVVEPKRGDEKVLEFSLLEATLSCQIIEALCQRTQLKPMELVPIGMVYEKLNSFVQSCKKDEKEK